MHNPPTIYEARIAEMFSSLQGEGTHMGERHLFIRFEECHIHCEYCDELDKPARSLSIDEVVTTALRLEKEEGPHAFVSLTGGEPLLYLNFLRPLLLRLKAQGFGIYLETNGILWQTLGEIIGWCDVIAMDLKPSSVTKERSFFLEHREFLKRCHGKEVFIKIIISRDIDVREFQDLIGLVKDHLPKTPVILQPMSPFTNEGQVEGHEDPQLIELLLELQRLASRMIPDVRVMPRLHRILKMR